jgi:hypothetical protein
VNNDTLEITAAFVGIGAMALGLASLLTIVTFAFAKVTSIESKISSPGKSVLKHKKIWGNDPLGRLMRSSYVFTFLILRTAPSKRLNRAADKIGDTSIQLPARLTLWSVIPGRYYWAAFWCFWLPDRSYKAFRLSEKVYE